MKIITEIVPLESQRYETLGDYFLEEDRLEFKITDTGNDTYNKLILIHELVEELMTSYRGITEGEILKWDLQHKESEDPGREEGAPYRQEHLFAEMVERMICHQLEISWDEYEKHLNKVFDGH